MALSYDDVYTIIAKYANSMLPYYCDSWNRFPVGENAVIVVNYLTNQADWYCDIKIGRASCRERV